jgi:hypothetical protein
MGLAVATTTTEARAHHRVQVKGWVALLTNVSNRSLTTRWARAHNMSRAGLMVKCWRPLAAGSIVYIRSQQLHFLAGWARVRHCRRAGWMYRIGLEFRNPLFTDLCDWSEGRASIAAPATLQNSWHPSVVEYCPGHAEVSTEEKCEPVSAETRPEVSVPTGGGNAEDLKEMVQRKELAKTTPLDSQVSLDNSGEQREDEAATDLRGTELPHDPGRDEAANTTGMAQPESRDASSGSHNSGIEAVGQADGRAHVGLTGDHRNRTNRTRDVRVPDLEAANDRRPDGIVGEIESTEPRNIGAHSDVNLLEMALVGYEIEKAKIQAAITGIQAQLSHRGTGRPKAASDGTEHTAPTWAAFKKAKAAPAEPKRKLSAAGRRAIIEATKKRWAAIREAKAQEAAPKGKARKAAPKVKAAPREAAPVTA